MYNKYIRERKKEVIIMSTVKNLPEYANEYKYIVASQIDGDLWFWGAWNNMKKAINAAEEIGGEVVINN